MSPMTNRRPWTVSAQQEYDKSDCLKRQEIEQLMEWMKTQPHLPNIDEEMMIHLHHACWYGMDRTKRTTDYLYTYRATIPELFANWDPMDAEIQRTINNILIAAPLPGMDKDGYKMLVCKLKECEPNKFNDAACIKWLLMSGMNELWKTGTHKGYVIIYDANGFTMSHLFKCSLSNVKNYINFGTYASPMRVVKIVVINSSSVIKKLFTIIKPFLSKDIINMMSFHTSAEEYFKTLPTETTPADYGGNGDSLQELHDKLIESLTDARDFLLEEETIKSDEQKRENSKKKVKENKPIKTEEID